MPTKTTPNTRTLTHSRYARLCRDISGILESARSRARESLSRILVAAYWNTGKRIADERLTHKAGYHNAILRNLAADLAIDERTLQNCVRFHQTYRRPPRAALGWSHYRELIRLRDPAERRYYERLAAAEFLPVRALAAAIKADRFRDAAPAPDTPVKSKKLPRPAHDPFLYLATVDRVVNGDTIDFIFDLGFRVLRKQRVRLASIDAPAIRTAEGRNALDFVLDRMNAYAERFVRSIKYECLNMIIPLGETHLRAAIKAYIEHYHRERNHQGLGNLLLEPSRETGSETGEIKRRERLGGLLNYYYREAA
jgi:hypothetical protein